MLFKLISVTCLTKKQTTVFFLMCIATFVSVIGDFISWYRGKSLFYLTNSLELMKHVYQIAVIFHLYSMYMEYYLLI